MPMHDNEPVETVLVVDDEPIVRDVVVRYLRHAGYATLEAADGRSARELIERESPNLVVLDVMLPGTNGLELCRWIRSRGDLAVILLTARGEEADRIVGLELGADDYVTKPFSPRELVARVKTVLRRSTPTIATPARIELAVLALVAVVSPPAAVLRSGWVMFRMGDDLKILEVAAGAATAAVAAGLALGASVARRLDRLGAASAELAAGDLAARAPEQGP